MRCANLLHGLDSAALEAAFRQHATGLFAPQKDGEMSLVALDGKVLKGSFDHLNDRRAAQALTAFASEAALLPAQVDIEDKDSEIPAAQRLIGELGVKGVLFTADAPALSKKTFEIAKQSGNFLLVQVQGQPTEAARRPADHCRHRSASRPPRNRRSQTAWPPGASVGGNLRCR